ncbi:NAD(+) diphosphatase [Catenovulum sediminis]|uniref:NAD(+) diphosphatase n=1 Tax=Catenovulum sediminis TaxID=1740262 RepID=UPI0011807F02|nr:NAD(+) diphosphatase [Catenovulum sediminis]
MLINSSKHLVEQVAVWVVVRHDEVWLTDSDYTLPVARKSELFASVEQNKILHLGESLGRPVYMVSASSVALAAEFPAKFCNLREFITQAQMDDVSFSFAAKAIQFQQFLQTHKFCGRCGKKMTAVSWELAMHCKHCQHRCYPRLSPCVIMAVLKDEQLLLAVGKKSRSGRSSILAGFVEPGETLEHAVAREVKEEVGIEIDQIQYFGSQPWPFPHQIMVGFIARYKSGEIQVDEREILSAAWYNLDSLPQTPGRYSIAGRMIDSLVAGHKNKKASQK